MIMEFSLINETGEEYSIVNVESGYITNVSGLGYKLSNSYSSVANTWKLMNSKCQQTTIKGDVVFKATSVYEKEALFTAFIRKSKQLRLKAKTPAVTKYIDVDVISYELQALGSNTLQCPIEMISTSLWYVNKSEKAIVISSEDDVVRYSYRFPSRFNDHSGGYYEVENNGSVDAGFMIEFYGAIDNPVVVLTVNGTETARVEIDTSITAAQRILFSSIDGNLFCYKGAIADINSFKTTGTPTNLTNIATSFSLSNENFFKLPIGTSRLEFQADSALTNPIVITTYKYYRAV